ncbi:MULTISPECIES: hypothetical protein [unclassified Streptomyces]|uniref:hypothetical protein n=1 Tax=unclassified Streptomyces TaxID=2593676 RepID=UPI0038294DE5
MPIPTVTAPRASALAAVAALVLPLTAGCGALDKALDCVRAADAITRSVGDLQEAVSSTGDDPLRIDEDLDAIDQQLADLKDRTGNADLGKAVEDLGKGIDNVRTAVKNGDETPDLTPVTDAASEVAKICTP